MANFKHSLIIDLAGNLSRRTRQFGRDLSRFTGGARRDLSRLSRAGVLASRGLDRLGNRYTAILGGAAGAGALRFVTNLERRLNRLGVQSNTSAEDIAKLKDRIFEVANAPDVRVDPSEIISAVEQIVEKTGDLKFARDNIDTIAQAIQATGGAGRDIGALTAEFRKFGLTTRKDVLEALDTLVRQGKSGSFTLGNLATNGERLAAAYAATGRRGQEAVRELGAVIQIVKDGTGNAEQATTAFEALLRTLQDATKIKALQGAGIQIFDPKQPGVMRSVADIMTDIIVATKGSSVAISQVFDAEAMRAFNKAAAEFKDSGALPTLERYLKIQGDGQAIMKDSRQIASDAAAAWQSLVNAGQQFADANLAAPIQSFADALNSLNKFDPTAVQTGLKVMAGGAAALTAALAARKVYRGGRAVAGLFRGGKGEAAGEAAAAAMQGGVVNVRVINWPATYSRTAGFSGRAGRVGRAGRLARFGRGALGRLGGPMALLAGGLDVADALTDPSLTGAQKTRRVGRGVGGAGGAWAGAEAGMALGAFGGPFAPVTVPLGGLIGGGVGYMLGEQIGDRVAKALGEGEARRPAGERTAFDVNVNLGGNIPPGTRITAERKGRPDGRIRIRQGPVSLPSSDH